MRSPSDVPPWWHDKLDKLKVNGGSTGRSLALQTGEFLAAEAALRSSHLHWRLCHGALVILRMSGACAQRALKHTRPFTEQGKIGKSRWRKFDIAAAVPTR